jgi:hypothetical protein
MPNLTETYSAVVTDNADDEERGRIRVACADLLGDDDADLPMWIEPLLTWGWFLIPDIGETVDIEIVSETENDEQYGQSSIDNLDAKWKGKRYQISEDGDEPTAIHPYFTEENYAKRRGFATPFGHILMFDDTPDSPKITLTWTNEEQSIEDTKISQIVIDNDGTMKLSVLGSNFIHIKENEVEMQLDGGASLKVTGKDSSAVTILGDGGVKAAIADHLETFYTSLKTFIEGAIVPTAMGPSGTILAGSGPATSWDSSINSNKLKFPDG